MTDEKDTDQTGNGEACDGCGYIRTANENNESECPQCGLQSNGVELDTHHPGNTQGEDAHMHAAGNNRVTARNRMPGTYIDRNDICRGQGNRANRDLLYRILREHVRMNCTRPTFADDCIGQIRALGLGLEIENTLIGIFRACLNEAEDEAEVGPLPRNEMRFMTDRDAAYRQRICVVAGLRAAAAFSLCEGILSARYAQTWDLEIGDCQRMTKKFGSRIKRLIVAEYGDEDEARRIEAIQQQRRTHLHRDNELSAQVCQLRETLTNEGLDNKTIRALMRQVSGWIRKLDEPGVDAVFANVRADMLVAILIRRAMASQRVRNLFSITAEGLGLSAGGVTQRAGRLAGELDYFLDHP
jgi:hypothetical protein